LLLNIVFISIIRCGVTPVRILIGKWLHEGRTLSAHQTRIQFMLTVWKERGEVGRFSFSAPLKKKRNALIPWKLLITATFTAYCIQIIV
jgi:hypothetical protein